MALNAIIYDCEIIRCIPPRDGIRNDDLAYCDGWHDYEGMGISVIGAYDYVTGQPPFYIPRKTRAGYSLDALALANLGQAKTGHGALAPELWQQGRYHEVIRYCLNDVWLTKQLFDKRKSLIDPTNGEKLCLMDLGEE